MMNKIINKKILIFLIFAIMNTSVFAGHKNNTVARKDWEKLMKLINEEIGLLQTQLRTPNATADLQYRLLSLYTEKIDLIKEKENIRFINAPVTEATLSNKDKYFATSRNLYQKILKFGMKVLKKYPNHRDRAQIYYMLALNSRDYDKDKYTEAFLLMALKEKRKHRSLEYNIYQRLAEYYFNQNDFKNSLFYYQKIVGNKNDEWQSKHLHNIGWCYFQEKNFKPALDAMVNAFETGKKTFYVDVLEEVFASIGIFFISSDKISDGAKFFIKNSPTPVEHLLKMAEKASVRGFYEGTDLLLKTALDFAIEKKNINQQLEIRNKRFDFYKQFKKPSNLLAESLEIQNLYLKNSATLSAELVTAAIDKIKDHVGFLQIELTKNAKKNVELSSEQDLSLVIKYFDIIGKIDENNLHKYLFLQGETFFSVKKYLDALKKYQDSFNVADNFLKLKKGKMDEIRQHQEKALMAMLGTLGEEKFPADVVREYKIFAFSNYLKIWPQGKNAVNFFKEIFSILYLDNKIKEAIYYFQGYQKFFPQDRPDQVVMAQAIIDFYIKTNNTDQLAQWIKILEKSDLGITPQYITATIATLGALLFDRCQKLEKENKKDEAIKGYILLYDNPLYPDQIKADSAFFTSILYLQMQETEESMKWLINSLQKEEKKNIAKKMPQLIAITQEYYLLQDLKTSRRISSALLMTYCEQISPPQRKTLHEQNLILSLINNNYSIFQKNYQLLKSCPVVAEQIFDLENKVIVYFTENRDLSKLSTFYKENEINHRNAELISKFLFEEYWQTVENDQPKKGQKLVAAIEEINTKYLLTNQYVENIETFRNFPQEISNTLAAIKLQDDEEFDEEEFNTNLSGNFSLLEKFNKKAMTLVNSGEKYLIVQAHEGLIATYTKLAQTITSYRPTLNPKIDPKEQKEFVDKFVQEMKPVAAKFQQEADNYAVSLRKIINEKMLLTNRNHPVNSSHRLSQIIGIKYPIGRMAFLIDTIPDGSKGGDH